MVRLLPSLPTASPRSRRLPANLSALAAFLLVGWLSACTPPATAPVGELADLPALRADLRLRRHVVYFATDSAALEATERTALIRFARTLPTGTRVALVLYGSADPRGGRTYNADLAARRARSVADVLAATGHAVGRIETRAFGEHAAAGRGPTAWAADRRVEVVATVAVPVVDGCTVAPARGGARLGCAVRGALAASLADPADLTVPKTLAPADGVREVLAIERYRTDRVRPLIDRREGQR